MLDDLAVLQLEDIDDRAAASSLLAHAVHMQDHVIAVGKYPLDLAVGVRKFLTQEIQECLEAFGPIRRRWIVLNIARPEKFCGGVEILLVKPLFVEFDYRLLVGLQRRRVGGGRRRCREREDASKTDNQGAHGSSSVQSSG